MRKITVPRNVTKIKAPVAATEAGISVDYYARLEQGRERNPSDSVLVAIGAVLGFSDDDYAYARALRSESMPSRSETYPAERLHVLVEAVRPNPAYVLDRVSNVIAINPEGAELFTGLMDHPHPNICRYLLLDRRARTRFVDWRDNARGSVAALRAANSAGATPEFTALVDELAVASPEFKTWWEEYQVAPGEVRGNGSESRPARSAPSRTNPSDCRTQISV
ncbi:MAG: helix-turn-helix transcriptional regulator [Gordonia sp. (in: high G+C Gram-positive bacteria)]|uniref:helix-turn-helix domain-containing protein n=1 Tax=Gordonia sp. (in: high G+C Gram-positive bacteria) TaxID=84139 RepID=UPI003C71D3ED